jgi:hypothetical protein
MHSTTIIANCERAVQIYNHDRGQGQKQGRCLLRGDDAPYTMCTSINGGTVATYIESSTVQSGNQKPALGATLALVSGIIGLLAVGGFWVTGILIQRDITKLESEKSANQAAFAALDATVGADLKALDLKSTALTNLYGNQKQWQFVLGWIESSLYKRTTINRLTMDEKGKVSMVGTVSSYTDYAKAVASLTDANGKRVFASVKVDAITPVYGTGANVTVLERLDYSLSGVLTPAALLANKNQATPPTPIAAPPTPTSTPPLSRFR